jgi:alpha-glucosidase
MNIFKHLSLTLHFIKFERFLGSLFYSYERDRWERQFRSSQTSEPSQEPRKLLQAEPTPRGGRFFFEQAELEICFLSTDLVRVDWKPGIPPIPYGIARQDWSEVKTKLKETAEGWVVSSTALKVIITEQGSLKLQNSDGKTLREELPPQRQGSAIHLDIDCKDDFRSFTIDPDRFPKLREFNQELAAKGVRLIAIVNPGVKGDGNSKLFQEGRAQEVFCTYSNGEIVLAPVWPGMCAFPDFTNPLARHWWSRQYEYLLDLDITGFWHDMNEPGVFTLWGDATLPRPTRHSLEGRGGTHVEAHNIYGLLQAQAGYEALCEYQPEKRPFIVSRSGWAGLQRYAWTWTGDVETSWQGLRQTVPTVLGMGLSGIPYTGPDIGGFKGNPSDELYLRWFQMASFLTFCRTHSANNVKPRTPWSYGGSVLSIVREFLRLRYRLIPYFYTLAWEATQTGHPPIRPLFWSDAEDDRLWSVEDAFLVGDALLVCPIVEEGARERNAILPKGYWYNFWDDALIEGGREVNLEAPLEQIPLLIKAGSIVPMEEGQQLILHLYPPVQETSEGCLYSDAGDGYGEWRVDKFCLVRDSNGLELTWEEQGEYGFPYQSVQLHLHGFKLQQAWVDGKEVAVRANQVECPRFRQVRFQG